MSCTKQKYIKQHEFFNEIIDQSVATLRLTTFINEFGNVDLVAAYLRVGSQDDAIVKSSSHIRIPVELKNGILNKTGYTINWTTIDKHPHTGFVFEGKELPQYEECIKTVISLHKKLPYVRIIGWDVVIDVDSKVKIMEWNGGHNDIKFSEATQGPIFKGYGLENLWKD